MVPALLFFPFSLYVGHVPPHLFSGGGILFGFQVFFPLHQLLPSLNACVADALSATVSLYLLTPLV